MPPVCSAPSVGLKPTAPQYDAGRSVEACVCVPSPAGTMPAPTAAAEPLDEPPGVRAESNGLVVGPEKPSANSVVTVLPMITAPPCLKAATQAASWPDCQPLNAGLFICVGMPTVAMMSLIAIGMPSTGESGLPAL